MSCSRGRELEELPCNELPWEPRLERLELPLELPYEPIDELPV